MEEQSKDPISLLLDFYSDELTNEIIINSDHTQFWKYAEEHIFGTALTSFREGIREFVKSFDPNINPNHKEMYNYFTILSFRIFSQPFTVPALKSFVESFDSISKDGMFLNGFNFTGSELSKVEQLLLFFCVHQDKITLTMLEKAKLMAQPRGKQ